MSFIDNRTGPQSSSAATRRLDVGEAAGGVASPVLVQISLASALFLAVLLLAAVMRFAELGALPLSPAEAETVLPSWSFWNEPGRGSVAPHLASPAYFATAAPFLALMGSTVDSAFADALARVAPAIAGLLAIAMLWLARAPLGIVTVLVVAALLAISPLAALAARTAGGDSLAFLALLVLLISGLRYRLDGGSRWLLIAAGAAGFGLTTSPLFYSGLLALLAAWLVQRRFGPAVSGSDGQALDWRRLLLATAITFLVTATFFLWRPAGLGGAAAILSSWLAAFALPGDLISLSRPLFTLARYELAAITLGAAALFWAIWRGYPLSQFFVYWYAAAFLLLLLQPGSPMNALLVALPAYFLLGQWLQEAFTQPAGEAAWAVLGFVLLVGVVVHFNGIRFVRLMAGQQDIRSYLVVIALVLAFAALMINLVRGWDPRSALQGTLLGLLAVYAFYGWGAAWWLAHHAANDPRAGVATPATDSDVRLLAQTLSEISYQTGFGPTSLPLLSAVDTPVLRWYLRAFPAARFGATVPAETTTTAIITAATAPAPPVDDYAGLNLGLFNTGVSRAEQTAPNAIGDTLRWWLFRESRARVAQEDIVLWVRQSALSWNR
jgi:hypothetical protein